METSILQPLETIVNNDATHSHNHANQQMASWRWVGETHTMGNLVCERLKMHEQVVFAGYRNTHPTEEMIILKIQTDKSVAPSTLLYQTLNQLEQDAVRLRSLFNTALCAHSSK